MRTLVPHFEKLNNMTQNWDQKWAAAAGLFGNSCVTLRQMLERSLSTAQIVSTSPWNLGQSRQIIHLEPNYYHCAIAAKGWARPPPVIYPLRHHHQVRLTNILWHFFTSFITQETIIEPEKCVSIFKMKESKILHNESRIQDGNSFNVALKSHQGGINFTLSWG